MEIRFPSHEVGRSCERDLETNSILSEKNSMLEGEGVVESPGTIKTHVEGGTATDGTNVESFFKDFPPSVVTIPQRPQSPIPWERSHKRVLERSETPLHAKQQNSSEVILLCRAGSRDFALELAFDDEMLSVDSYASSTVPARKQMVHRSISMYSKSSDTMDRSQGRTAAREDKTQLLLENRTASNTDRPMEEDRDEVSQSSHHSVARIESRKNPSSRSFARKKDLAFCIHRANLIDDDEPHCNSLLNPAPPADPVCFCWGTNLLESVLMSRHPREEAEPVFKRRRSEGDLRNLSDVLDSSLKISK
jgi:hypothetical protein